MHPIFPHILYLNEHLSEKKKKQSQNLPYHLLKIDKWLDCSPFIMHHPEIRLIIPGLSQQYEPSAGIPVNVMRSQNIRLISFNCATSAIDINPSLLMAFPQNLTPPLHHQASPRPPLTQPQHSDPTYYWPSRIDNHPPTSISTHHFPTQQQFHQSKFTKTQVKRKVYQTYSISQLTHLIYQHFKTSQTHPQTKHTPQIAADLQLVSTVETLIRFSSLHIPQLNSISEAPTLTTSFTTPIIYCTVLPTTPANLLSPPEVLI